jgi:hypothetical protein
MVKFSAQDFASATTTSTITRPQRPKRILIPTGNFRLPVAPPSPSPFDGIDDKTNTEAFPDFEDPFDRTSHTEPLHCVLHCGESICNRMIDQDIKIPLCRCAFEKPVVQALVGYRPPIQLDNRSVRSVRDIAAITEPSQEIDIHHDEVFRMLAILENSTSASAMHNHALTAALCLRFPGQEKALALRASETFFGGMHLYFSRTLRSSFHRNLTNQELRDELDVYLRTMLRDWVDMYYCGRDEDRVLQHRAAARLQYATFGAPSAVLAFWRECVEDVVGRIVWRDEEVRRVKMESMAYMALLGLAVVWFVVVLVLRI